jgi:hypothetical protein
MLVLGEESVNNLLLSFQPLPRLRLFLWSSTLPVALLRPLYVLKHPGGKICFVIPKTGRHVATEWRHLLGGGTEPRLLFASMESAFRGLYGLFHL